MKNEVVCKLLAKRLKIMKISNMKSFIFFSKERFQLSEAKVLWVG